MPRPSHISRFDHPNNIGRDQIINLPVMYSSPLPCYLVPLRYNIPLSTLFSNTLSPRFSLNMRHQVVT
jgi:hypothetical protein